MKDSHFKSVSDLNHLAHLPNTPFWDVGDPVMHTGASPFFAQPEMGSVRFQVQTMGRRLLPSATRVRPGAHSARCQDSRNDLTPCRMAWHFVSAGSHASDSDQTLGPTPTRGSSHSARRLRSLASLCSSTAGAKRGFIPFNLAGERR